MPLFFGVAVFSQTAIKATGLKALIRIDYNFLQQKEEGNPQSARTPSEQSVRVRLQLRMEMMKKMTHATDMTTHVKVLGVWCDRFPRSSHILRFEAMFLGELWLLPKTQGNHRAEHPVFWAREYWYKAKALGQGNC